MCRLLRKKINSGVTKTKNPNYTQQKKFSTCFILWLIWVLWWWIRGRIWRGRWWRLPADKFIQNWGRGWHVLLGIPTQKFTRSRIPQHRLESPGGKAFTRLRLTFDPSGRQEIYRYNKYKISFHSSSFQDCVNIIYTRRNFKSWPLRTVPTWKPYWTFWNCNHLALNIIET